MGFFESINFHSFSIGAIIPFVFLLFSASLFISIKNKSKSAIHLTIAISLLAFFYLGYIISSCVCHPLSAYHRWLTVGTILYMTTHFILFFFYFPFEKKPVIAKIYLIMCYTVSTIVIILFYIKTIDSQIIYNFSAHYWDFEEYTITKIISYMIQFLILNVFAVGLWRFFTTKTEMRWVVLFMIISILCGSIVPSVANILSRYGVIDRDLYNFTLALFNIFGFFTLLLLYVNNCEIRLSFLAKMLSLTISTFLVLMQFIGYLLIQEKETSYDREHKVLTTYIVNGGDRSSDFKYLAEYTLSTRRIVNVSDHDDSVDLNSIKQEFINTGIYETIKSISSKNNKDQLSEILGIENIYIDGYRSAIEKLFKLDNSSNENNARKVMKFLDSIEKEIQVHYKKIEMIRDKDFRSDLKKYLSNSKPEFGPFRIAIENFYGSSKLEGKHLKSEVLKYLVPMTSADRRNYRYGKEPGDHFVAFMRADIQAGKIYEAGYYYYQYRKAIHNTVVKIFIVFGLIIIIVRYGFNFFFINILVRPLNKLRLGVQAVKEGNLDVQIPVKVQDEIGYATHAFNDMVLSVKDSKDKLIYYANNLEEKVEERTVELKSARDALWGEMQLAKKIQEVLLPQKPHINGYDIVSYMNTAVEVGGDYYDVINCPENDWVIIGDVSGHGVPASLIMLMVRSSIRTCLENNPSLMPSELIESVNQAIKESLEKIGGNPFVMINVFLFASNGEVVYSGRNTTNIIYRHTTREIELIKPIGIVISDFNLGERGRDEKIIFYPGDALLLYSDGIVEARDADNKFYGEERLADVFLNCADKSVLTIKNSIIGSLDGYSCDDDVSIVVIKKKM